MFYNKNENYFLLELPLPILKRNLVEVKFLNQTGWSKNFQKGDNEQCLTAFQLFT